MAAGTVAKKPTRETNTTSVGRYSPPRRCFSRSFSAAVPAKCSASPNLCTTTRAHVSRRSNQKGALRWRDVFSTRRRFRSSDCFVKNTKTRSKIRSYAYRSEHDTLGVRHDFRVPLVRKTEEKQSEHGERTVSDVRLISDFLKSGETDSIRFRFYVREKRILWTTREWFIVLRNIVFNAY